MAAPSALVFKVPELAQMGYALDQQAEKKRKAEEKEREQYAKSLGVEAKMLEGGFKLVGTWKEGSQLAFNQWKEANIEYLRTGSDEAKSNLEARTQQFNQIFGTGLGASTSAASQLNDYRSVGGKGYIARPEEVDGVYKQFTTPAEFKVENGMIMVSDGDRGFVPATQSSYFATETNPSNTFMLEKRNPELIGYNPDAVGVKMAQDIYRLDGVRVDNGRRVSYNTTEAGNRVESEIKNQMSNDPGYAERVATWYYAKKNGLDMGNLGMADLSDIQSEMRNEAFMEAATSSYITSAKDAVIRQRPADQVGAPPTPRQPTSREMDAAAVLSSAYAEQGAMKFPLGQAPVKISGQEPIVVTGVSMDAEGNITGYDAFFTQYDDYGNMIPSTNNPVNRKLTKQEASALNAELKSRGLYSAMVSQSKANAAAIMFSKPKQSSAPRGTTELPGRSVYTGDQALPPR